MVGCEYSGRVRNAFRDAGHDAWSCDLLPSEDDSPFHVQGDVLSLLNQKWDLGIFHPPCRYLAVSGLHWNKRNPERAAKTEEALEFVRTLMSAPIERIALENPVSCISSRIRKPDQIIQPYEFGEDASKKTCLWLKNLDLLTPTQMVPPRLVDGKPRWSNQTDSGQNRLGPSKDRWKERSRTFVGVAKAIAEQWGRY